MWQRRRTSFLVLTILAVGSLPLYVGSSSAFIPSPTAFPGSPDDLDQAWSTPGIANLYSDAELQAASDASPEQEASSSPDSALAISLGGDGYFAQGLAGGFGFQTAKPSLTPYFIGGGIAAAFVAAYLYSEGDSGVEPRISSAPPTSDSNSSNPEAQPPAQVPASDPDPLPGISLTTTTPTPPYQDVPEPGAAPLMGVALAGLIALRVRRAA